MAWIIIAWGVLRFNLTSVATIAVLAAIVIFMAAVMEFLEAATFAAWRWLHITLGVLFLITAIITIARPGNSFVWIAAFICWYLLFKGIADIIMAFAARSTTEGWWLTLIVGILELGAGFWAAGRWDRSAYLLIVLVGAIALARGITDIVNAFRLRHERHQVTA